jgi:hypothetical protein
MTAYTYTDRFTAHYGKGFVIVPDQIAADQKAHDRAQTVFRAYRCDMTGWEIGGYVNVRVNGDAYGLWTTGTGDMRVSRA